MYLILTIAVIGCNNKLQTLAQTVVPPIHIAQASQVKNTTYKKQQIAQTTPEQYLDDRSTPVQVLKSYYNAINSKEYVRAYSYWNENDSTNKQLPAYPKFVAGYSDTVQVNLKTGKTRSEGAAGSVYTNVPVTLLVTNKNGAKQTFVGCYITKQVNPKLFSAPPFKPTHIYSAKIRKISNNENAARLMEQSCK